MHGEGRLVRRGEAGQVERGAVEALREQLGNLAKQLLPEMVGLVDAFGFSDWELDSAVGLVRTLANVG